MTQSQGNNVFDASDIQRYHSGQMSAEERHALEKAALDDPFLADALEGYTYTSTAAEDLVAIRERLEQKTSKRKVVPLFTKTWMKVAAILLVMAGGVWLLLNTQNNSNQNVAVEPLDRKVNVEKSSAPDQNTIPDSASVEQTVIDGDLKDQASSAKQGSSEKIEKPETSLVSSGAVPREADEKAKNESFKSAPAQNNYSIQYQKEVANGVSNIGGNSRSINDMNRTMPQVNVQDRLASNQVNANRVRSWADSDSGQNYMTQRRYLSDSVTQLNVVMTPQPTAPLNEVVVSRNVAKKESEIKGRMSGVVIDTLEPAEGWTNFDDYIAGNLKVPDELKLKPISGGEVELSFEVNQKGEPVNITVVKSLCTKCDEEAKRLLKEGPKWKKKKNNKGRVTIRF